MTYTVLVCGGTKFRDEAWLNRELDEVHRQRKITRLVHGAAPGADTLAAKWGFANHIFVQSYPAKWNDIDAPGAVPRFRADGELYNAAAGPIRNREMLQKENPDLVVAFPGGVGTADMVMKARKKGIKVMEV